MHLQTGDGLFEHVGGGVGRAEACEAHRQPHPGDPVQEGSPTGHCYKTPKTVLTRQTLSFS